jgi:tetratricopeptide (TPR) repeat protein
MTSPPPAPTPTAPPARWRSRAATAIAAATIIFAGLLVYANSLSTSFVFDDFMAVLGNATILDLHNLDAVFSPPRKGNTVQARPLTNLSFAWNYALGGHDPRGYHAFNVAVHLLAALTLFGIARRTRLPSSPRPAPNSFASALAISLLWTVHPLHTASVTYIAQRAESLMGLSMLLTLYAFIRGATVDRSPSAARTAWFTASTLACAAGMGCKEVMVVAPLVVWLYDRAFLAGSWRELWAQRRGPHLALASTWLVFLLIESQLGGSRDNPSTGFSSLHASWRYLLTQSGVILHYLRLAFWPDRLCIDYYGWPLATSPATVWPALLVVGALAIITLWACVRSPRLGFPGAWFFLILAPTSSLMPVADRAAEHRMYLPLAAIAAIVVVGVQSAYLKAHAAWQRHTNTARPHPDLLPLAFAALLAASALGARTILRNLDYRSNLSLWLATLELRPQNPRALMNVGAFYGSAGASERSIRYLQQALTADPTYAPAVIHANIAAAHMRAGRFDDALRELDAALQADPRDASAWYNRAVTHLHLNQVDTAIGELQHALAVDPTLVLAHCRLGMLRRDHGQTEAALAHFADALRLRPDHTETYVERARLWLELGDHARATADLDACRRHGDTPPADLLERLGK